MSRPKPNILTEKIDKKTFVSEQVLEAEAIYSVFYKGHPINLRTMNKILGKAIKYRKCSFSNPGHAINLAKKLNEIFSTEDFSVFKLDAGVEIPLK